jgi:hypothetical protein
LRTKFKHEICYHENPLLGIVPITQVTSPHLRHIKANNQPASVSNWNVNDTIGECLCCTQHKKAAFAEVSLKTPNPDSKCFPTHRMVKCNSTPGSHILIELAEKLPPKASFANRML